jgi:riboflavin synthase
MFTGIVQEIGRVKDFDGSVLSVFADKSLLDLQLGESIAVSGACLTVSSIGSDHFAVDIMPETLRRTNFGVIKSGTYVNLERALTPTDRLGGHILQGHVDDTGRVVAIQAEQDAILITFESSSNTLRYIVEKGFIAIDGISLTVTGCDTSTFGVSVVQYTLGNTNIGQREEGELVNLEIDIFAKYVEKFLLARE